MTASSVHGTALLVSLLAAMAAAGGPAQKEEIVMRQALLLPPVGRYGRSAVHTDAVEAQIVAGHWQAPKAGDIVTLPDGSTRSWQEVAAREDGWFEHETLNGGYACWSVPFDADRLMILEAAGHSVAYVNGEPRAGDPYGFGLLRLPVALKAGRNQLLFRVGRGRLRARLVAPPTEVMLDAADTTLPDLVVGEAVDTWGALVVTNATTELLADAVLQADWAGGTPTATLVPAVPPLGTRKVGFRLQGPAPRAAGEVEVSLRLTRGKQLAHSLSLTLRVREPLQSHQRTFLSAIDGSVQYYAVLPARPLPGDDRRPALFLTLHGAGVEAIGQADAYSPKTWGHLVAATNRRPFGFDWEEWGRLDALEVLEIAQQQLGTDPDRVYLTGHSMGGHGTWQLGVQFPDRFAAIGPSAGWISFWSYAGGQRYENASPIEQMLNRAASPGDTLALARNTSLYGVYILHGAADDNVPVEQARTMNEHLQAFHRDLLYFEKPGAGHWWDDSDEPGAACVDWPPLFDFFARHARPPRGAARRVDFTTANPGVSAWCHWVGIEAQIHPLQPSSVRLDFDPWQRRFLGTTNNVARLALDLEHLHPGEPVQIELDGQKLKPIPWPAGEPRLWLARIEDAWAAIERPSPTLKGPHRYGPFKEAFQHRMMFVYGTQGTPAENAWALAKARCDAETWRYRGNGSVDVIPDTSFSTETTRDRAVILYGNADTQAAWEVLLADSPVQVRRGAVRIGERTLVGEDMACLFLRPRPDSERACVAVVAGSGLGGMRLTDQLPYFVSGVAYPDLTVIGPEMLTEGSRGVRVAGFFGNDWGVERGEFVWRQ